MIYVTVILPLTPLILDRLSTNNLSWKDNAR